MTCAETTSRLSAYHDGELPASERNAIAAHLADCPACRAYLQDLADIGALLRADGECEPPATVWERISAAAERMPPPRVIRLRHWSVRAAAVAAGFVLYILGYGALKSALRHDQLRQLAQSTQIEQLLHETGVALAGGEGIGESLRLFEDVPEAHFVNQLLEEVRP